VIRAGEETAVLGVDGWADARCGDYRGSTVRLDDFRLILELTGLDAATRFRRLNAKGRGKSGGPGISLCLPSEPTEPRQ